MTYTTVRVKCSNELIAEIDSFMLMLEHENDAMEEFLREVKEGVKEKLSVVNTRIDEVSGSIYAEFFMTLPKSVYDTAKGFIADKPSDHSELHMLFENIVRIKEYLFKR